MTRKDCHQLPPPLLHSLSPLLSNFVSPPTQLPPGDREGPGSLYVLRLSFLLAKRVALPTGHPGSEGRGLSWHPAGGAA